MKLFGKRLRKFADLVLLCFSLTTGMGFGAGWTIGKR